MKTTVAAWAIWALVVGALLAVPVWGYLSECTVWHQHPCVDTRGGD
jgi:hypothetical protein